MTEPTRQGRSESEIRARYEDPDTNADLLDHIAMGVGHYGVGIDPEYPRPYHDYDEDGRRG